MRVLFDVGGTNTRLALTEDGRSLRDVRHIRTDPGPKGPDKLAHDIKSLVGQQKLELVAGGMPGHARRSQGLRQTPNLPDWAGQDVVGRLEQVLKVPVIIENDTAVVGLGEAVYGAGRDHDLAVYMTVSTGVNGVRIVRRSIDVSVDGFELGAMLMSDEAGKIASLESLTGGAALARRHGRPPSEIKEPAIWRQEARYLAQALYNTLLHWSPEVVVYGGAMMRDISVQSIAEELALLPPVFEQWPEIKLAQLGDEGGLYGAMALLQQQKTVKS